MLKTFTLSFVRIARLVRISNNSRNAFHEETIRVETASEQPPHWPILSPRYLKKVDSTWKLPFPMLTSLKFVIAAGTISSEYLRHLQFLVSVRWPVIPEYLLWTHRSHKVLKMELAPTPKVHTPQVYFGFFAAILVCWHWRREFWFCWHLHRGTIFLHVKPCDSSEVFQAASLFLRSLRESLNITRSSAYSNSQGQLTLNAPDKASITLMNRKGLSTDPWCTPTDTLKGSLEEPFTCILSTEHYCTLL